MWFSKKLREQLCLEGSPGSPSWVIPSALPVPCGVSPGTGPLQGQSGHSHFHPCSLRLLLLPGKVLWVVLLLLPVWVHPCPESPFRNPFKMEQRRELIHWCNFFPFPERIHLHQIGLHLKWPFPSPKHPCGERLLLHREIRCFHDFNN